MEAIGSESFCIVCNRLGREVWLFEFDAVSDISISGDVRVSFFLITDKGTLYGDECVYKNGKTFPFWFCVGTGWEFLVLLYCSKNLS